MKKGMEWKYIFNTQPASLIWIAGGEGGWKLQILKRLSEEHCVQTVP